MNKSFQESNGTVLSTNWKEIGSQKTEVGPLLQVLMSICKDCTNGLKRSVGCIVWCSQSGVHHSYIARLPRNSNALAFGPAQATMCAI